MIIASKLPAQIAANYGTAAPAPPHSAAHRGRASKGRNDQVSVSNEGRELYQLVGKLRDLPDVREERVAFLKGLVDSGQYSPNAVSLAERLIETGGL